MKEYDNIDDFFKEGVSDFRITPSKKVWDNIESAHFKSNSNSRRNYLLLALISLLFISGSIISWTMYNDNSNPNTLSPVTVTDNDNEPITNSPINIDKAEDEINTNQQIETLADKNESYNIIENENEGSSITSANEEVVMEPTYSNNNISKLNDDISVNVETSGFIPSTFSLVGIDSRNTSIIENSYDKSLINNYQKITIENYLKKRKNLHFYTGASVSIAMAYYSSTTDQSTWSADLLYGLKLKRYYIETGIGFQKMKEQGNYQIEYITNDSIGYYNKVVSFELNPQNPNEITYKTSTTTVYDSIEHRLLQSPLYYYDYLVIPVKFGYKFFQKPQFSISAETGLIYSYLLKTYTPEVNYNDPDSQLIGITNNTPERVEHNFRIHIALRLNYNITSSISLSAQPEFTSFINSIYKPSYNTISRPYTMGIRFGICFDF